MPHGILATDVSHFHYAMGELEHLHIDSVSQDQIDLRLKLLQEEVDEYAEACKNRDIVEIADALADIAYIVSGTANIFGIPFAKVWAEVQRSNMAKVDPNTGLVRRREDGKILKPAGWEAPKIAEIMQEHISQNDKVKICLAEVNGQYYTINKPSNLTIAEVFHKLKEVFPDDHVKISTGATISFFIASSKAIDID